MYRLFVLMIIIESQINCRLNEVLNSVAFRIESVNIIQLYLNFFVILIIFAAIK